VALASLVAAVKGFGWARRAAERQDELEVERQERDK